MTSTHYAHQFSVKNIPFGIASSERHKNPQGVTRVENTIVFLNDLDRDGLFKSVDELPSSIFAQATLNSFAALPKSVTSGVRKSVQDAIERHGMSSLPEGSTEDISKVTMHLPVDVKDFTGANLLYNFLKYLTFT